MTRATLSATDGMPPMLSHSDGPRPNDARLGERALEKIEALARFTDVPGQVHRLFLSPAHRAGAAQVADWMRQAGCDDVHNDALGTVVGRYEGREPGLPALLIGSHIDSVKDAGKYDGNLGVVAALLVVEELARGAERLPFAVEILCFGDEENVRFPTTLASSRALAGTFAPEWLGVLDEDGVSLSEALTRFGGDPGGVLGLGRAPASALAYIEVHIEQGPVLEAEGLPVGIVTTLASIARGRAVVRGEAGHAGTVPMTHRRDALAAAAEMIVAMERLAAGTLGAVATVGVLDVTPKAGNVIPGEASFSLDLRAPDDETRRCLVAGVEAAIREIARRRAVDLDVEVFFDAPATPCSPIVMDALERAVTRAGLPVRRLPSGAGHDAMAMARLCPSGMLFVRCERGISHNPAEFASVADMDTAVRVLLATVRAFQAA